MVRRTDITASLSSPLLSLSPCRRAYIYRFCSAVVSSDIYICIEIYYPTAMIHSSLSTALFFAECPCCVRISLSLSLYGQIEREKSLGGSNRRRNGPDACAYAAWIFVYGAASPLLFSVWVPSKVMKIKRTKRKEKRNKGGRKGSKGVPT